MHLQIYQKTFKYVGPLIGNYRDINDYVSHRADVGWIMDCISNILLLHAASIRRKFRISVTQYVH